MSSEARWLNMIEAEKNWLAVLFNDRMTGTFRLFLLRDWLKHHRN